MGFIARYLGLFTYGEYYYIYAFILIIEVASDLGLRTIVVREIAKDKAKAGEYLGSSIILKTFISVIAIVFVFLFALLRIEPSLRLAFYIAGFAAVTQIGTDVFSWLFRGFEKMEYETAFMVLNRMVLLLLVLLGIHFKYDLTYFFLAILLSNLIRLIATSFIVLRKFVTPKFKIDFKSWKSLLFQSAPLGLSVLVMTTSRRLNIFLLEFLRNKEEVSLFSSAFAIILVLIVFPRTLSIAAFPVFSQLANTSKESLSKSFEMFFKFFVTLSVPITLVLFVLAQKIILLIFGHTFAGAVGIVQILSLSLTFRFLNFLFRFILSSIDKQKYELVSASISLSLNGVLGYLLISSWGYWGASLTLLITEACVFFVKYSIVSKYVSSIPIPKIVTKPIICALLMGFVLFLFRELNIFLLIFLGGGIYISTLLLLKNFFPEELNVFRRAIRWQA